MQLHIEPKFTHDCDRCVFIGHVLGQDLYLCSQPLAPRPTVIARFGSEGPEYSSGLLVPLDRDGILTLRAESYGLADLIAKLEQPS